MHGSQRCCVELAELIVHDIWQITGAGDQQLQRLAHSSGEMPWTWTSSNDAITRCPCLGARFRRQRCTAVYDMYRNIQTMPWKRNLLLTVSDSGKYRYICRSRKMFLAGWSVHSAAINWTKRWFIPTETTNFQIFVAFAKFSPTTVCRQHCSLLKHRCKIWKVTVHEC